MPFLNESSQLEPQFPQALRYLSIGHSQRAVPTSRQGRDYVLL